LVGIPNYTLFRRDRLRGKGGGVCAYVRNSISCSVFVPGSDVESRPSDVEILWLVFSLRDCHYFMACCYHPPKPQYNTSVFIDVLSSDIDYINSLYPDAVIIIAGDFNQLNTSFLDVDHGLVQMVSSPILIAALLIVVILLIRFSSVVRICIRVWLLGVC